MKRPFIILMLSLVFSCAAFSEPDSSELEKRAREYKGYDELIQNITPVQYKNATYYWVEYSRNLAYSSSVVLDSNISPVKDDWEIKVFTVAEILHKNYPPQAAEEWYNFAAYFSSISGYFNQSGNLSMLAQDSNEVAILLYDCSGHLKKSIESYSPKDAELYLESEKQAIERLRVAYANYEKAKESGRVNMEEYEASLVNIHKILVENQDNLDKASSQLNKYAQSKIMADSDKQNMETILMVIGGLLMLVLYYLRAKRSNSSRQAQPPQAKA